MGTSHETWWSQSPEQTMSERTDSQASGRGVQAVEPNLHITSGRARSLPGGLYRYGLTPSCLEPGESPVAVRSHVALRSSYVMATLAARAPGTGFQRTRHGGIPKPATFLSQVHSVQLLAVVWNLLSG